MCCPICRKPITAFVKIPDQSEFPGTGLNGNGIPAAMKSQGEWLTVIKTLGCGSCHQLGNKARRSTRIWT